MATDNKMFLRDVQGGAWDGTGLLRQQLIQQQLETEPRPFTQVMYNFVPKFNMTAPSMIFKLKDWDGAAMHVPEAGTAQLVDFTTKKIQLETYKIREGFGISHEMNKDAQYNMISEATSVVRDRILERIDFDIMKLAALSAYGTPFKNTNLFIPLASSATTFDEYTHYIQPYACDVTATTGQTYLGFHDILRMIFILKKAGRTLTDVFIDALDAYSLKSQITPVISATVPYGVESSVIGGDFARMDPTGFIGTIFGVRLHISNHCQYLKVSDDVSTTDAHVLDASYVGKDWEWIMEGNEALWDYDDTTTGGVCGMHHRVAIGIDATANSLNLGVYEDITAEPEFRNVNQTTEHYMYTRIVPFNKYGKALTVCYGLSDVKET